MTGTALLLFAAVASAATINVPIKAQPPPNHASLVLPLDFMSFSIEFSSFADYGGNNTHPNHFSKNLIANLAAETGVTPIIRIGGATGDRVTYKAKQKRGLIPYWDYTYNLDQPKNLTIGPAFWQSLTQLESTARYIFQLNSYKNDSTYLYNMQAMVNQTLDKVASDSVHLFEIGNENDVAVSNGFRPPGWSVADYVYEWLNRSASVNDQHSDTLRFMAPSFSSINPDFSPYDVFNSSLDMNRDGWVTEVSQHLYMDGAQNSPTLTKTLMNHTQIKRITQGVIDEGNWNLNQGRFFALGETNSIYGQGAVSVSDVFGAALWEIDFALYLAANNVRRVHFHQGTSYRYASWLPVQVNSTAPYVKPPYYGNVFLSRFVGPSGNTKVMHYNKADTDEHNVAYAAYDDGKLARVALLNMLEYNGTSGEYGSSAKRPSTTFTFPAPKGVETATVELLRAPQAHSTTGISMNGYSYSYANGLGKPVKVRDDTATIKAKNGVFSVKVEASGAVIVRLPTY